MHGDTVFVDMCHDSIISPKLRGLLHASTPEFPYLNIIPPFGSAIPGKSWIRHWWQIFWISWT